MTKRELIDALAKYPDDVDVFIMEGLMQEPHWESNEIKQIRYDEYEGGGAIYLFPAVTD